MKKQLFFLPLLTLLLTGCGVTFNSSSSNSSVPNSSNTGENTSSNAGAISEDSSIPAISSSKVEPQGNQDNKHRNYYQLLVYSFADSNGDGWGDFKGIADKLDYLQNLGINGLWLSPFLEADDYHGYNVKDYQKVDSRYEVNNFGITKLLEECHKRDIKVLMDLVLNHTSVNHAWYSQHREWYSGDDAFGGNMKDLDYSKSAVVNAIKDVGRYWLNKGIDGFRLDAAMWIFNNSNGSVDHNKNYAFWKDWCSAMRQTKQDVYIIGEVLNRDHDLTYQYAKAGFDATFDFNAPERTYELVKNSSYDYAGKVIADYNKITESGFVSARALSNHDFGRFTQQHPSMDNGEMDGKYYFTNKKQLILSNAINALTPGATFIYYGDELGLKGNSPDGWNDMSYRTPMPWDDSYLTKSTEYYKNYKGSGYTTSTIEGNSSNKLSQYIVKSDSIYQNMANILKAKLTHEFLRNASLVSSKDSRIFKDGLSGFSLSSGNYKIHFVFNGSSSTKTVEANNVLASTVNKNNNAYQLAQYDYVLFYES